MRFNTSLTVAFFISMVGIGIKPFRSILWQATEALIPETVSNEKANLLNGRQKALQPSQVQPVR
jgi:hypothetical protein